MVRILKTLSSNIRRFRRKKTALLWQCKPIRVLAKNTRAVSPVVANLVLVAAVLLLGFAALSYARSVSNDYQTQYGESVGADIAKLKEKLAFEYAYYNSSGYLHVYVINAGSISVHFSAVHIGAASEVYSMTYLNGTSTNTLNVGEEAHITVPKSLAQGTYSVKLLTVRGSSFDYSFVV